MTDSIKNNILKIWSINNIDMMDVHSVQLIALDKKMYDLVVYLNNNVSEYISFINDTKNHKKD